MRSPVPTVSDDQLDDIKARQRADRLLALHESHYDYAQQLDAKRRRDIADLKALVRDLLDIIETGLPNHGVIERARRIAGEI